MIFRRVAHAAHAHDATLARREGGFGGQVFGTVARHADGVSRDARIVIGMTGERSVVERGGVVRCELGSFQVHVSIGERVLDCLVLTDGAREDDAVAGVVGRSVALLALAFGWKIWVSK